MKKQLLALLATSTLLLSSLADENVKTIRLIQDDAQDRMVTKVYELKHLKASDVGIYVEMAVHRYNENSNIRMVNFSENNQQLIVVTTAEDFIPYVDQIVATLDRGTQADKFASKISGVGYDWKVYWTKYRDPQELMYVSSIMGTNCGNSYTQNGALWVLDNKGSAQYVTDWIKYLDRPVPQVQVTFRYYTIRESSIKDIGLDYLSWKNGPGMNLLNLSYSAGETHWNDFMADGRGNASWSYGGIFFAPSFDMSFIKMLQQNGNASIAATATVTLVNNQSNRAVVSLSPQYSAISKDDDLVTSINAASMTDMTVIVEAKPVITIFEDGLAKNKLGQVTIDNNFYARNLGSLSLQYGIYSKDATEADNYGTQVGSSFSTNSTMKTVEFGHEQLLSEATREYDVEQTTGIPYLCKVPVLKYLFGSTTTMKEKVHSFVTIEANLIHPETSSK